MRGKPRSPNGWNWNCPPCDPARSYQVINCGGVSYASYRLAPLVKEVLHYQPDLVILATGHNEFLEDRTYQALKSRPAAWAGLQNAAYSLRLVNVARRWAGKGRLDPKVATLTRGRDQARPGQRLCFLPSRRCLARAGGRAIRRIGAHDGRRLPRRRRSGHPGQARRKPPRLPAVQIGTSGRPFRRPGTRLARRLRGRRRGRGDRPPPWRSICYRKAEAIDGEYALLAYRIARTLDRLGRKPEALTILFEGQGAGCLPVAHHPAARGGSQPRVAAETGTPLVDAAALLAAQAPDSIPGFDWYLDHVHPNIGGHQRIAQALAEEVRRCRLSPNASPWPEEKRRQTYADHLKQLGPRYLADGRRRVVWLDTWARRQRLLEETLPATHRAMSASASAALTLAMRRARGTPWIKRCRQIRRRLGSSARACGKWNRKEGPRRLRAC